MAEKKQPVFVAVDSLRPGSKGHNLQVKVRAIAAPGAPAPRRASVIEWILLSRRCSTPRSS